MKNNDERTNALFFYSKARRHAHVQTVSGAGKRRRNLENVALEEKYVAEKERNVANRRILLQILP